MQGGAILNKQKQKLSLKILHLKYTKSALNIVLKLRNTRNKALKNKGLVCKITSYNCRNLFILKVKV